MTPARRWGAALAAGLLGLMVGGLALHAQATRQVLQQQFEAHNVEAASVLATALGQQPGTAAWRATAAAQFALGGTQLLRVRAADGRTVVELQQSSTAVAAPAWFRSLLPLDAPVVSARIVAPGQTAGELQLQLQGDPGRVQDALWASCLQMAAGIAVLAALVGAGVGWAGRRWQAALRAAIASSAPLAAGAGAPSAFGDCPDSPDGPASSIDPLPTRYAEQAAQVASLQRQAQLDAVTGLPLRQPFMGRLQQRLAEPGGPGSALLLVRVARLQALNRRLGHADTDRLLVAVADVLATYVERVPGTFAGRLNGSDFALCLPVPGVAAETAASLRAALASAPALRASGADVVVGGSDGVRDTTAGAALAAADEALARAEAGHDIGASVVLPLQSGAASGAGARAWREQIGSALADQRIHLAESRLVDCAGREVHLACRLRVQLSPGGDFETAERWLALARRSRLMPQVDLAAVDLALRAIARDGRARAVHVSPVSIASAGFVGDVAARLADSPAAARGLCIEWAEALRSPSSLAAWAAAAAAWRPLGVRLGAEHADSGTPQLPALQAAGVEHLNIDARHLHGLTGDLALRGYVQGLVELAHGLGLRVLAAGIADGRELEALWALGFDGASGPPPPPAPATAAPPVAG